MNTATAAIANHLNVAASAIVEVQEWARVLWVRVKGLGARFVSKKVAAVDSVTYKNIKLKPVTKAVMEVYRGGEFYRRMDIKAFSLTCLDIPARQHGSILFDLRAISGQGNAPKKAESKKAYASNSRLNPQWVSFNNCNNEGATDGYNPYPKYI